MGRSRADNEKGSKRRGEELSFLREAPAVLESSATEERGKSLAAQGSGRLAKKKGSRT